MLAGLRRLPHMLRKRRCLQKHHRVSVDYIESILL
jgi:hypothetical protein